MQIQKVSSGQSKNNITVRMMLAQFHIIHSDVAQTGPLRLGLLLCMGSEKSLSAELQKVLADPEDRGMDEASILVRSPRDSSINTGN